MFKSCSIYLPIGLLAAAVIVCAQDAAPKPGALTAEQKQVLQQKVQSLEGDAKAEADKQNAKIAEIAKSIDRNLLSGTPSEELDRKLSADFAKEVSNLVNAAIQAKLTTVREMVKVLTPDQKTVLLAELEKPGANPDLAELLKVLK
jgi:Spy/CpxP family protein refolding chaperone